MDQGWGVLGTLAPTIQDPNFAGHVQLVCPRHISMCFFVGHLIHPQPVSPKNTSSSYVPHRLRLLMVVDYPLVN